MTFSNTDTPVKPSTETVVEGRLQRVWAYLTVKQLLEKELLLSGPEKENVKKKILELSLQYNFVTPLTSMVVTKPEGEKTQILHKPKEGKGGEELDSAHHRIVGTSRQPQRYGVHGLPGVQFFGQPSANAMLLPSLHPPQHYRPVKHYPARGPPSFANSMTDQHDPPPRPPHRYHYYHLPPPPPPPGGMGPSFPTGFARPSHKFLLKAENQSHPLCFNVDEETTLKLFHHPSIHLLIFGQLNKGPNSGFKWIIVHLKSSRIVINGSGILTGQTSWTGSDHMTAGSVTVTKRDKEIDVVADEMYILILIHEENGNNFLWPVLQQRPSANNTEGILAVKPVDYEVNQHQFAKLKIHDKEVTSISTIAVDYSVSLPAITQCWLVSPDEALQRPLHDFFFTQSMLDNL